MPAPSTRVSCVIVRPHDVVGRWSLAYTLGNVWVLYNGNIKGFGNAHRSNVVVRGTYTAGGKDIVVGLTYFIDGIDDDFLIVWYHSGMVDLYSPATQSRGYMIEVNVLGSTREDFVADNDDAGSDGLIHS